ncbi:PhzF family phenazine biosynthesis isomerase [Microbacterium pumilum]|uniref:PhzF family phenazine biosynthesis isomerase n=1 Tax=Microbacterium pumilum TaxID=344165 RepID=A0ABP5DG29_9MICO
MSPDILRYAAFTDGSVGGNPAGVVLDAGGMVEAEMLAIAGAIGYSETAFAFPQEDGSLRLRFFSPLAEVAFCGHATIATAIAITESHGPGPLRFDSPAGLVEVATQRHDGELWATLTSPPASSRPATENELGETLDAFGWQRDVLDDRYPAHVGFAGNHHMIVGLRDRATLSDFDYDYDSLAASMSHHQWTTVHVFAARSGSEFDVRNAFPPGGVREDPATGAAAAAFGGYLRTIGSPVNLEVVLRQGQDMGSPSRLLVSIVPGSESVRVSGTARVISAGADDRVGGR